MSETWIPGKALHGAIGYKHFEDEPHIISKTMAEREGQILKAFVAEVQRRHDDDQKSLTPHDWTRKMFEVLEEYTQ